MYGFIIVLIFIFFGFALIFLEFSEGKTAYGDQLYGTFKILFAGYDDTDYSVSQKLFTSLILFLLNVVLLNLLISIMGDSYDKVQEKRVLTDSLTRLDMSLEAMVFLRVVRRGKKTEGRGYLIYCEPEEADNEDDPANVEWEGRINVIKKTLKQTDQKLTDKLDATNQKIGTMEERMSVIMEQTIEQKMGTMEERMIATMEQTIEQKMGAMEQKIEAMEQTIEQKMGTMEERMSATIEQTIEQKIGAMEQTIEQKMGTIEERMSATIEQTIEQKMGAMKQKIEAMEQTIEQKMETMEERISATMEQTIEQKMGAMEQTIEQKMGAMEQKMEVLNQNLFEILKHVKA